MKKLIMVACLFLLLGGSVGAVTFDKAMQEGGSDEGVYNPTDGLFPSWRINDDIAPEEAFPKVQGVVGINQDGADGHSEKLLMLYIPHLINILLKFVAPLIMAAMIYAGIRFVYAGSNEEELSQAKQIFTYTLMGALFVILSYSIMKALYFLLTSS